MLGTVGRAVGVEKYTAIEDAVGDHLSEVVFMRHATQGFGGLVRGKEHGSLFQVPLVADVEQQVGLFPARAGSGVYSFPMERRS